MVGEDLIILVGGPNKKTFVYDVAADTWEEKAGKVVDKSKLFGHAFYRSFNWHDAGFSQVLHPWT